MRQQTEQRHLEIFTHVLLASSVAGFLGALVALGDTTSRRVSSNVVGASARSTDSRSVAAKDDVAAHAVVGVRLGAIDLGTRRKSVLGFCKNNSRGGDEDGSVLHLGGKVVVARSGGIDDIQRSNDFSRLYNECGLCYSVANDWRL